MNKVEEPKTHSRLVAIDLLRGFSMFAIIVNHVRFFPNLFVFFTGGTFLWVSFAEAFFAMAGFVFAYSYYNAGHSWIELVKKAWSRAVKLYLWSICLTILFTLWGNLMPRGQVQGGLWILHGDNWLKMVTDTLLFRYVYGWANYLPYYCIFLFFLPAVFVGLKYLKSWPIIGLSLLIWYFRGTNVYMAQQIIFVIGIVLGCNYHLLKALYLKQELTVRRSLKCFLVGSFLISFLVCLVSTFFLKDLLVSLVSQGVLSTNAQDYLLHKNDVLRLFFDKKLLGIGRLFLDLIWFSVLYLLIEKYSARFRKIFGGFLEPWGKNSLTAYLAHALIVFPIPVMISSLHISGFISYSLIIALALFLVNLLVSLKTKLFPYKTIFD